MVNKMKKFIFLFTQLLLIDVIIDIIISYPFYLLWNEIIPSIFDGVNQITWLQAFGVCIMANLFALIFENKH